jgi:hypothetical protein
MQIIQGSPRKAEKAKMTSELSNTLFHYGASRKKRDTMCTGRSSIRENRANKQCAVVIKERHRRNVGASDGEKGRVRKEYKT